ncbi:hypothetical protein INTERNEXUS_13 [Bacillus phage vB_BspM_Internexus]|nr:hypothetical protein DA469_21685 [Bacillus subtilis]QXN70054.1 hypothetical protein INTERNEXUS_13 [Bacillus phage vB_BspM_Internexus]
MKKGNCYNKLVNDLDLVVAETSEFNLTRNKVYLVHENAGVNQIIITNDKGLYETYATEYFRFYEGEPIEDY